MSEKKEINFDDEAPVDEYVIRHRDLNSLEDIKKVSDPPPRPIPAPLDRGDNVSKWNLGEEAKERFADKVDVDKVFGVVKRITAFLLSAGIIIGLVFVVKWAFLVFEPDLTKNKPAPSPTSISQEIGINYYEKL